LHFGLATNLPPGRDAALRILDRALARNRLSLANLNNTSLLLLLALLPGTSAHRPAVAALVAARGLQQVPDEVVRLLQSVVPPRLDELVEISRPPGPHLRQLALSALYLPEPVGLLDDLCLYLGRLQLIDPARPPFRNLASGLIAEATSRYSRIPIGTVDYRAWLYRVVRLRTQPPANALPIALPPGPQSAWFGTLTAEEQQFLDTCWRDLPEPALDMLYLHFYARLSVEQISGALQLRQPDRALDAIVRRLEESWDLVL